METEPFRQIGKGFCASVWAPDRGGPSIAMKREDGGPYRSALEDSIMHKRIERSLKQAQATLDLATSVHIPQHHAIVSAEDHEWWNSQASRFPPGYQHCNTLLTERILPLHREAREKLIDLFCSEKTKELVKHNRKDEDCLIRPYIGKRARNATPSQFFTLRNKPLCINQMEAIKLPVEDYIKAMAEALAVIYWHSRTDANDIEFVLAPGGADGGDFDSDILGRHSLWVLDFDCVNVLTHNEADIEQAASAYLKNDPFWPRPASELQADQKMWDILRTRFLQSSKSILGDGNELPLKLINRSEDLGQARRRNIMALRERWPN